MRSIGLIDEYKYEIKKSEVGFTVYFEVENEQADDVIFYSC